MFELKSTYIDSKISEISKSSVKNYEPINYLLYMLLQFDMKYYYEIGSGKWRRRFWFFTPPKPGPDVPYTFGLIGINICL